MDDPWKRYDALQKKQAEARALNEAWERRSRLDQWIMRGLLLSLFTIFVLGALA